MSNLGEKKVYRWVLLEHIGSPDDIKGIHFDLLLEDREFCRTWRLSDIPLLDGPYVDSFYSSPHDLYWLDIEEKVVSGNRGVATRIKQGIFLQSSTPEQGSSINLSLIWDKLEVDLVIDQNGCRILSKKSNYFV
ncbi:hypothetical protein [Prochlorococcus marinus]|uniref:hypothetical protein n=1 Tax=Prochlorococcus marinus TaxID=1219 RepID=UPI0022B3F6D7|nr:hypothetical protein [Prochlorococcus marinus]